MARDTSDSTPITSTDALIEYLAEKTWDARV